MLISMDFQLGFDWKGKNSGLSPPIIIQGDTDVARLGAKSQVFFLKKNGMGGLRRGRCIQRLKRGNVVSMKTRTKAHER